MSNPKRSEISQKRHDQMVRIIAEDQDQKGYEVKADDIDWKDGKPRKISGHIPDIVIMKDKIKTVIEVETCTTFKDTLHTKEQIKGFAKRNVTHVFVPHSCMQKEEKMDPVDKLRNTLDSWNLSKVKIGTCNLRTGELEFEIKS